MLCIIWLELFPYILQFTPRIYFLITPVDLIRYIIARFMLSYAWTVANYFCHAYLGDLPCVTSWNDAFITDIVNYIVISAFLAPDLMPHWFSNPRRWVFKSDYTWNPVMKWVMLSDFFISFILSYVIWLADSCAAKQPKVMWKSQVS